MQINTSLMASFGVWDPQLVPSNTTQDKKVKQNTFVLYVDQRLKLLTKGKQNL